MKIMYTCDKCGLEDIEVEAPERGDEDVVTWLTRMATPPMVADHGQRSPLCRITSFTHVKIPLPEGSDRVGRSTRN